MNFSPSQKIKNISPSFFAGLDKKISQIKDKQSLISLAQGSPDQPTPGFIIKKLKQSLTRLSDNGYPPFAGKDKLLKAIAKYYKKQYKITINPNQEILTLAGSQIGISALPQVMLNPGDYVVTTDPCYPDYYTDIALAGGKLYQLPINKENHFLPNLKNIPEKIVAKTKMLFLNYPNNPTGAVATKAFFKAAINFGKAHHILVANDFAYSTLGFNRKPISLLQTKDAKQYAVELNTLSKAYDMAGWRIGYILGNKSVIAALK